MRAMLETARLAAEKEGLAEVPISVGPHGAYLRRGGATVGNTYFRWVIECGGIRVHVKDRLDPHKTLPNATWRVDGTTCLAEGPREGLARCRAVMQALGFTLEDETLSRVDPCVELVGVEGGILWDRFCTKSYVSRIKSRSGHESSGVSTYYGSGPLMIRLYDKTAELRSSGDKNKWALMVKQRWGGAEPESACRAELQIRRERLRSQGVRSPDDWFFRRAEVIASIVGRPGDDSEAWFRLTTEPPDRKNRHHDRCPTDPVWRTAQAKFEAVFGEPLGIPCEPCDRSRLTMSERVRNMMGYLTGIAAVTDKQGLNTKHDLARYAAELIKQHAGETPWRKHLARKRQEEGLD